MQLLDSRLVLSATDLANFLSCPHRSALDLAAATGLVDRPDAPVDRMLALLRERGDAHERAYLEHLRCQGLRVVEISGEGPRADRVQRTREALASGADVVYQGAFAGDGWIGYADFLRKVDNPPGVGSAFGSFHYEPWDTKLARETRGTAVLQLALYADLLAEVQGCTPERFHVVSPGPDFPVHTYRWAEYAAYFRAVRRRMTTLLARGAERLLEETYPEPVEHCDICRWWKRCNARRRADDHLCFVAGAGRAQRTELKARGVTTLAAAAALPVPVPFRPVRGSVETYNRLVEQAQVQLEQRERQQPVVRLLPVEEGHGLCRLPEPSPGDLFLDLEGARFVREGGHDYLFGLGRVGPDGTFSYRAWWAWTPEDEKRAFEALVDEIIAAKAADPRVHVYHYAPYEPTALKRLAGRYATRQEELDRLLRAETFVDLFAATRQAIRAGAESYSLKDMEQYCGFRRSIDLREAGSGRIAIEAALEARQPDVVDADTRAIVEGYNRDDVEALRVLRDWLEAKRAEVIASGTNVPRPVQKPAEDLEPSERAQRAEALRARLLEGVPFEASEPGHPLHERWLLAYLVDFHHREEKAEWWEFFRLRDLPDDELLDEPKAIAGLECVACVEQVVGKHGRPTGSAIHRYRFPPQEVELKEGDKLRPSDGSHFAQIKHLDRTAGIVDVKVGKAAAEYRPTAVFHCEVVSNVPLQESIIRFAERLLGDGFRDARSAAWDLLARNRPRLRSGSFAARDGESLAERAIRVMLDLDHSILPIQGPPGSGKTYLGAQMIRAAVRAGLRVGVTAQSHQVIQNLIDAVREQAAEAGEAVSVGRVLSKDEPPLDGVTPFRSGEKGKALDALTDRSVHVLGGTAWVWASEEAEGSVDVLFIDEAGQFSLGHALAVAPACGSLVLLGDPQQLEQPRKATHPDGVGVSALTHILGGHETMPDDRGLFMPETRRLAPPVCEFTSELFYDGRLAPIPALAQQRIVDSGRFDGAGLYWVPVEHRGNRNAADEEVEAVERLVDTLLGAGWIDDRGRRRRIEPGDLRVVAPYNAHVNRLAARLDARGVQVGTVDRFQGQTCAAVIYSMATSDPADAPRGMDFLYSLNRLNVATSRGRCAAFIVASPALLEPECRTPRQMQLANGLCRFVEKAIEVRT